MDQKRKHQLKYSQGWKKTLHDGVLYGRIPYGNEEWVTTLEDCSCGASIGMLHVLGCPNSKCPACGLKETTECVCDIRLNEEV